MTIWPLVVAAGIGTRMQADRPKQYLPLHQRLLIDHTLERLLDYPGLQPLTLVLSAGDPYWSSSDFCDDTRIRIAEGGPERCYSVLNGLRQIASTASADDWVLVHDVARPCLHHRDLDRLLSTLQFPGAILASPVRDTMKRSQCRDGIERIDHTVDREQLWHALTPQVFPLGLLTDAIERALAEGQAVTDEASALEYLGYAPMLVAGRADNIKVTRPEDLALAELFIQQTGYTAVSDLTDPSS